LYLDVFVGVGLEPGSDKKFAYRRGCKKVSNSSDSCQNGCKETSTGRTECVCTERLCNDEAKPWTEPCGSGPSVSELNINEGAVMIVDTLLMFMSFIISQLL